MHKIRVQFPGVRSSKTGTVVGGEPNLLAELFEVDELAGDLSKLDHLDHRHVMLENTLSCRISA
jgi:hypothetical protein